MKSKVIMIFIFIVVYGLFFYKNTQVKNERIEFELNKQIRDLEIHYSLTKDYFLTDAKSMSGRFVNDKRIINILSKVQNATDMQKKILRKKLYKLLIPMFKIIQIRGVAQLHITLPNNISFLRMHKPEKYDDDLTNTRYSFKYVNENKKSIEGFEQGKSTHAFRYTFPCFSKSSTSVSDKSNNYLGAIDISLSSNSIQDKLLKLNKIHSHFLVDKKIWETKNLMSKYIQSIEDENYMFALTEQHSKTRLANSTKHIIEPLKDEITKNLSLKTPFSLYTHYNNTVKVITFLPIKNIKDKKVVAYIVSYTDNNNIYNICSDYKLNNIIILFCMLILFYFIYKNLIQKNELKQKNKNFEYLLDTTMEAIVISDKNNKIIQCNQSVVDLFKVKNKSSFLGRNITDFVPDYEIPKLQEALQNAYDKPRNYDLQEDDGTIFPVLASGRDIIINEEKVRVSIILDLTQIKQQEQQLFKSEKMASMGEMIENIAHQWRQPLNSISITVNNLSLKCIMNDMDKVLFQKELGLIDEYTQHLSKTIDDFRNYIKGDRIKSVFKLNHTMDNFLTLMDSSIKNNYINIIYDIDKNIEINGYENELIQCLINIFNNAKDILVENEIEDKHIFLSTSIKENKAIIKIKDNAGGIPEKVLPKIFEPYFTTKHQSQGTGLGLHMTYNLIVDGMGGTIEATNQTYIYKDKEYIGAEFSIILLM